MRADDRLFSPCWIHIHNFSACLRQSNYQWPETLRSVPLRHPSPPTALSVLAFLRVGEDLKKIVSGSWVAWKQLGDNAAAGGPLFVKDAFYNFMCPQRPKTV